MDTLPGYFIGIDPGFDGAIAFYHPNADLIVYDMPCVETKFMKKATKGPHKGKMRPSTRRETDLVEARRIIQGHPTDHAYIEWVAAGKQQGATSMFRFGEGFGEMKGILICTCEFTKVKPQKWKKYFGLSSDKKESLELARVLFPNNLDLFKRVKDNGRAEAALIAKYGWEQEDENNGRTLASHGSP